MVLQALFLVSVAVTLLMGKKHQEASIMESVSELTFHGDEDGGISQNTFHRVEPSISKLSNCKEDETRRCNPTTGWNKDSPHEEKSLLGESSEKERSGWCNQSEFRLHCSQDDECRSPGVCQHISCHYPHVAEFRYIPGLSLCQIHFVKQVGVHDEHPGSDCGWHCRQPPHPCCRPLCQI